jgi:2-oxoglutarate dehydrogenase E1 component
LLEGYERLREIIWVQEEPQNMGAWSFVEPRLREIAGGEIPVNYVGKPARPSPAQGSAKFHKQEHAEIVRSAFASVERDLDDEEGVEETQASTTAAASD